MDELDISEDIAALRSTFADIRSVVGVDRLEAEIADLSEQAGVPDLWDDPDKAQKVFLSQNRSDDAFWLRYKAFGAKAEQVCSG